MCRSWGVALTFFDQLIEKKKYKMKIRNFLAALLISFMLMGATGQLMAQDTNAQAIRQELKVILEELPLQAQQDVLRYAKAKQMLVQRQADEAGQAAQQESPQPAPASQAATAPQAVTVKPGSGSARRSTTGQRPQRPAYMEQADAMEPTTVEWYQAEHDFGEIKAGETVKHTYRFKNTGDQPLKLTRVKASCGCTTPSWSKEAIAPGEEGFIEVAFNSRGKRGPQRKSVVVTGNFEPVNKILRFQGEVKPE